MVQAQRVVGNARVPISVGGHDHQEQVTRQVEVPIRQFVVVGGAHPVSPHGVGASRFAPGLDLHLDLRMSQRTLSPRMPDHEVLARDIESGARDDKSGGGSQDLHECLAVVALVNPAIEVACPLHPTVPYRLSCIRGDLHQQGCGGMIRPNSR
jgi:hypothetical protein